MATRASGVYANLYSFADQIDIIDTHEHLPAESERTGKLVDFSTLFSHYCVAIWSPQVYKRMSWKFSRTALRTLRKMEPVRPVLRFDQKRKLLPLSQDRDGAVLRIW